MSASLWHCSGGCCDRVLFATPPPAPKPSPYRCSCFLLKILLLLILLNNGCQPHIQFLVLFLSSLCGKGPQGCMDKSQGKSSRPRRVTRRSLSSQQRWHDGTLKVSFHFSILGVGDNQRPLITPPHPKFGWFCFVLRFRVSLLSDFTFISTLCST